ncbi:MAG: fructose-bisphosphate aldolase [Verrucomicrobia subdivision 3 bacterium]|nr:fructose-bisphosphate aldolase [Verrucomicrobiota bacterium]MCC6822115.1 fructose-bisphosphate aldolase [Limisphaerales bacterium]
MKYRLANLPGASKGMALSGADSPAQTGLETVTQSTLAAPWQLSFPFGRTLLSPAMNAWLGSSDNVATAQTALHPRAKCNGLAVRGKHPEPAEQTSSTVRPDKASLHRLQR